MSQRKIALVTGGSRGLGKEMVLSFAKKGLDIILTYNSKKAEAEKVVSQIEAMGQKAVALQLDVAEVKTFETFFNEVSSALSNTFQTNKFDYLVNNAGIGIRASFVETTEEQFDTLMNIQFKGNFFLTQRALNFMADGGGMVKSRQVWLDFHSRIRRLCCYERRYRNIIKI